MVGHHHFTSSHFDFEPQKSSFSTAKLSQLHAATPSTMYNSGPRLKNGVDLQLQDAFYRENWLVAARLAEKRARTLNDQYYEASTPDFRPKKHLY